MATAVTKTGWKRRLVQTMTCPNCWHEFPPEDVLYVAKHPDLIGDAVLGTNEYRRFAPMRFTHEGEALDDRGQPTAEIACPRCHIQLPELLLEVPPLFISLVGSPASGKSYFLTVLAHTLRNLMPKAGLRFTDAHPTFNEAIREHEDTLFSPARPDEPTEIAKTAPDDERLYRQATIDGVTIRFPLPLQFSLWPMPDHPTYHLRYQAGRVVVLYDNAGEDFLPGTDSINQQTVKHLARSDIFIVLFDPTQEARLRPYCNPDDPQVAHGVRPDKEVPDITSQEVVLTEAARRTRSYQGRSAHDMLEKPVIVIVPKFDALAQRTGIDIDTEPYHFTADGEFRVKSERIERTSDRLRDFLAERCPDFVATAESLSEIVLYVPVSSLGRGPTYVERGGEAFYGIRPADIRPKWVTAPLLYCLGRLANVLLSRR